MDFSSNYTDVVGTSTQAVNLLNYAMNFDSFRFSDYVIFCDEQYSYYIVWGKDFSYTDSTVVGNEVEYVRYYRSGSTTSYSYIYDTGTWDSFSLTYDYLVTSNLNEVGVVSPTYVTYEYEFNITLLFVLAVSILFAMMLRGFRKWSLTISV